MCHCGYTAGVRPETGLAKAAGLALGKRGGIVVDAHMATSDPHIYAVGEHTCCTGFFGFVYIRPGRRPRPIDG
jgi:NAD(P)H-nitrite reductase large subunit